ncbi:hypothetical protein TrLO_g2641 [Triparma laevis f. longispina]|nr:hypothetical protein TrLO_g2641 [Triparma laevis f. longispina]
MRFFTLLALLLLLIQTVSSLKTLLVLTPPYNPTTFPPNVSRLKSFLSYYDSLPSPPPLRICLRPETSDPTLSKTYISQYLSVCSSHDVILNSPVLLDLLEIDSRFTGIHLKETYVPSPSLLKYIDENNLNLSQSSHGSLPSTSTHFTLMGTMYPTLSHPEKGSTPEGLSILPPKPNNVIGIGGIKTQSQVKAVLEKCEGVGVMGVVFGEGWKENVDDLLKRFTASRGRERPKKIKIDITGGIARSSEGGGGKVVWDGAGGGRDMRKEAGGGGKGKGGWGEAKGAKKERIAKQRGGGGGGGVLSVKAAKRGGKTVTIISPVSKLGGGGKAAETLKMLKTKLATGGTQVDDCLEVQGDHVEKVKKLLSIT